LATDVNGNTSSFSNALAIGRPDSSRTKRLDFRRFIEGNRTYQRGGTLDVFLTVELSGLAPSSSLEIVEHLPENWFLSDVTAGGATESPSVEGDSVLRWK